MVLPLKRMTNTTRRVLWVLLEGQSEAIYGFEVYRRSGITKNSVVYAILNRLEEYGWVDAYWEGKDPSNLARPLRRYYKLTSGGKYLASQALSSEDAIGFGSDPFISAQSHLRNEYIKPNVKHRFRQETISVERNFITSNSICEIELNQEIPDPLEFPLISVADIDDGNPFQITGFFVDGVDYVEVVDLRPNKITIDLVNNKKIYDSSVLVSPDFLKGKKGVEVGISSFTQLEQKEKPVIHCGVSAPTEEYILEVKAPNKKVCSAFPNLDESNSNFVNSNIGLGMSGVLDLKESARCSKDIEFKDNEVIWSPKSVKLGYEYFLELDLEDVDAPLVA